MFKNMSKQIMVTEGEEGARRTATRPSEALHAGGGDRKESSRVRGAEKEGGDTADEEAAGQA